MGEGALEFDQIAREVFAPIYPVIAKQIRDKTAINSGICVDVGSAGGYLGIELARISELYVYLLDKSEEALTIADKNIVTGKFQERMETMLADVHKIPLPDQSVNLVISRGSIYFWEDQAEALKEIYRILIPGGVAYIGGGFGRKDLKDQITIEMKNRQQDWRGGRSKNSCTDCGEAFVRALRQAGIPEFQIIKEEVGLWIFIKK